MVDFITVGSCLVGMPSVFLRAEYKWNRINHAGVSRSDVFLANFVDRAGDMPPREEIEAFCRPLPEHRKFFMDSLAECYPDTAGLTDCAPGLVPLRLNLDADKIDLILMDSMLETYARSWTFETPAGHSFTSTIPFHLCENKDEIFARHTGTAPRLTPSQSIANWKRIIRFFREAVPRAPIIFACQPYCLSEDDMERYRASRDFYLLIKDEADAMGIGLIPPLDVERKYTKLPDDNSHFEIAIYKAMAGHIVMCHLAKLSGIAQPYTLPDHVIET
jgi:hypothetical protein